MKKHFVVLICIILLLFSLSACNAVSEAATSIRKMTNAEPQVRTQNISFENPYFNPTNCVQFNCSMSLMEYEGQLYFYIDRYPDKTAVTAYENKLFVCRDGNADLINEFEYVDKMLNGTVYYYLYQNITNKSYYAYNVVTKESNYLAEEDWKQVYDLTTQVDQSGVYYIPYAEDTMQYYPVRNNEMSGLVEMPYFLSVDGCGFYIEGCYLMVDRPDGATENLTKKMDLLIGSDVIPCKTGALILCESSERMLSYYDAETGTASVLFTVEALDTVAAVNCHEGYVYLSFKRYERFDSSNKFKLRYENDTIEGTYRISLNDGSCEKISDNIYSGLFIFDDSGIYAVSEENNIFKLSFEGDIIDTILQHN